MRFPRSSGLLLHPTSLPGRYGIGEIGAEALRFLDYAAEAGQKLWQVLPLAPTGYGDSPYQAFSAFAGNPLLISLDSLAQDGVVDRTELGRAPAFSDDRVDFGAVIAYKFPILRRAAHNFFTSASPEQKHDFESFCSEYSWWLDDFALFMAAKEAHDLVTWTAWDRDLALRKPEALERWREKLSDAIAAHKFWQFTFHRQWSRIRQHCASLGIRIMGDIPIYVAHDSADVWANPDLFYLEPNGDPSKVAGVPPDYFSATGQLWGNPIYRWDVLKQRGYDWWVRRFRESLKFVDLVRLDHFRGFEAYWEIPAGDTTAKNGRWVKGPGADLFKVLTRELGDLPVVAENLGVITPEVEAIRHEFGFPGMAILQFAFSTDPQAPTFRPHNYVHNLVAYTGGHDNDTMCGWWNAGVADSTRSDADVTKEKNDTAEYFNVTREQLDREVNWVFIREVHRSVADTVLVPMQDVLGLGSGARMNLPGSFGRWWQWRMRPGSLRAQDAARLREFVRLYDR
jgi:4-alpha-glucanotransferase